MKVFWVLAWCQYYPGGKLNNVESTWSTYDEAIQRAEEIKSDEYHGYDFIEIVDISEMIGE